MPIIGVLMGGVSFAELSFQVGDAVILYGNFIQAIVNFIVIALVIFWLVRSYNKLQNKEEEAAQEPAPPTADVVLLTEIRDLLKKDA
jgi:large conductance mechanosensitive channel